MVGFLMRYTMYIYLYIQCRCINHMYRSTQNISKVLKEHINSLPIRFSIKYTDNRFWYITGCQLIPIFLYNSYILGQNPIFWKTSYFSYICLYFEHHSYIFLWIGCRASLNTIFVVMLKSAAGVWASTFGFRSITLVCFGLLTQNLVYR